MIQKTLNNPFAHKNMARLIPSLLIHKQSPYYIIIVGAFILYVATDIGLAEKFIIVYFLSVILIRPDVKYSVAISIFFIILIPLEQAMGQTIVATQSAIIAFWSICFGLLLTVLNVMTPNYAYRSKITEVNDTHTNTNKEEGFAKERQNYTKSDIKQSTIKSHHQAIVKTLRTLQQPTSIPAKQETQQHPQTKPPTKRKLIQG